VIDPTTYKGIVIHNQQKYILHWSSPCLLRVHNGFIPKEDRRKTEGRPKEDRKKTERTPKDNRISYK
jgi:hypothetical protein